MLFEYIAGHALPKRAIEVAVAGGHGILFVGPRGAGKQTLVDAHIRLRTMAGMLSIPSGPAYSALCCWCGFDDLTHACHCSERARARFKRYMHVLVYERSNADVLVEVCHVPVKELGVPASARGTSEQAAQRASQAALTSLRRQGCWNADLDNAHSLVGVLDDSGLRTMEMAVRRLGLGTGDTLRMLRVARTIADLRGDKGIRAVAVAEAVQYRCLPQLR